MENKTTIDEVLIERFALDNNNNILDFEDPRPQYCLTQEDVCALLNKQHNQIVNLKLRLNKLYGGE